MNADGRRFARTGQGVAENRGRAAYHAVRPPLLWLYSVVIDAAIRCRPSRSRPRLWACRR